MSLAGLPAARLFELGGLRERCSATLRCTAHDLALPCDLCEVEDGKQRGAVCDACGQQFPNGLSKPADRACSSAAVFAASGRIAFADEAVASLHRFEAERRRDDVERERAERARSERERLESERLTRERLERERSGAESVPTRHRSRKWSVALLALSALTIGFGVGYLEQYPRVEGTAAVADQPQAAGATATTDAIADRSPRPAPLAAAPATTALAVPFANGFVTDPDRALSPEDAEALRHRLELMASSGTRVRLLIVDSTGAESIGDFGTRVGNAWNAAGSASYSDLLVTLAMRDRKIRIAVTRTLNERLSDKQAGQLLDRHFTPVARQAGVGRGLRVLIDQIERALAASRFQDISALDLKSETLRYLDLITNTIARWDGKQPTLPAGDTAALDSAIAQLESMPRPPRGDRKAARRLHASGLSLIGQAGFESLAVEKLQLAHDADPLDVQVLNDLAYAEMSAGQYPAALGHLLRVLRMAPTRASAWVNLAETVPRVTRENEVSVDSAIALFSVGYWFSQDRAKMVVYLTSKTKSPKAGDAVGLASAEVLARLGPPELARAAAAASDSAPSR